MNRDTTEDIDESDIPKRGLGIRGGVLAQLGRATSLKKMELDNHGAKDKNELFKLVGKKLKTSNLPEGVEQIVINELSFDSFESPKFTCTCKMKGGQITKGVIIGGVLYIGEGLNKEPIIRMKSEELVYPFR